MREKRTEKKEFKNVKCKQKDDKTSQEVTTKG